MTQYVRLYLDHPKVGCGFRSYLVLRLGPKWARLFLPESATTLTIRRKEADEALALARPLEIQPRRMARRIRDTARSYGAEDAAGVREALQLLSARKGRP